MNSAGAGAMGLAAADEDRGAAIAVTGGAAALLRPNFLPVRATSLRSRAARAGAAAIGELPGDDAVEDVGARLDAEHGIVELDVAAGLGRRPGSGL